MSLSNRFAAILSTIFALVFVLAAPSSANPLPGSSADPYKAYYQQETIDGKAFTPYAALSALTQEAEAKAEAEVIEVAAKRTGKGVRINVNLSKQRMSVYENGRRKYTWKISSGRKGHTTPTGSYRPTRMHRKYTSRKYGAAMPHSIFFYHGYAIHGTYSTGALGRVASRGCVRLHPSNARTLYNLVSRHGRRNTRIRIFY